MKYYCKGVQKYYKNKRLIVVLYDNKWEPTQK